MKIGIFFIYYPVYFLAGLTFRVDEPETYPHAVKNKKTKYGFKMVAAESFFMSFVTWC